jgi:hypothetical protein
LQYVYYIHGKIINGFHIPLVVFCFFHYRSAGMAVNRSVIYYFHPMLHHKRVYVLQCYFLPAAFVRGSGIPAAEHDQAYAGEDGDDKPDAHNVQDLGTLD